MRLLQHDLDSIHTKEGFKRAVVGVLRELGFLRPSQNGRLSYALYRPRRQRDRFAG